MNTTSLLRTVRCIIVIAAASLGAEHAFAQSASRWQPVTDIRGGHVTALGIGPDGAYYCAVDSNGLYRSPDGAQHWSPVGALDEHVTLRSIAFGDGGRVYVGSGDGVFRYHEGVWVRVFQGVRTSDPGTPPVVPGGVLAPDVLADGEVVLARAMQNELLHREYAGVWRSADHGQHWQRASGIDTAAYVFALTASGGAFLAWVEEVTSQLRLYRSDDRGATFHPTDAVLPPHAAASAIHAQPDGTLLLAIPPSALFPADPGVRVSTDGGVTWERRGLREQRVLSIQGDGDTLLAVSTEGVHRSYDRGHTWKQLLRMPNLVRVMRARGDTLLACGRVGVIGSAGGERWSERNAGILHAGIVAVFFDGGAGLCVRTTDNGSYRSLDGGRTWERLRLVDTLPERDGDVDVIGMTHAGGVLAHPVNAPERIEFLRRPIAWWPCQQPGPLLQGNILQYSGGWLAASSDSGLYGSADQGASWTFLQRFGRIAYCKVDNDGKWLVVAKPGEATAWYLYTARSDNSYVMPYPIVLQPFTVAPNGHFLAGGNRLQRSVDKGASWVGMPFPELPGVCAGIRGGGVVGVLESDASANHRLTSYWLADTATRAIAFDTLGGRRQATLVETTQAGDLLLGTAADGLYRMDARWVTSDVAEQRAAALCTVTPNPADDVAEIAVELPGAGHLHIDIFDILGNRVATLADQPHAEGRVVARWSVGAVAAGRYLCRVLLGDRPVAMMPVVVARSTQR